jgi:hypothetical protein
MHDLSLIFKSAIIIFLHALWIIIIATTKKVIFFFVLSKKGNIIVSK